VSNRTADSFYQVINGIGMNKQKRPESVPAEANWNKSDKVWELGPSGQIGIIKKRQFPVGEWRYWRADGSLSCIANFDDKGNQHGKVETFHPDGTLASSGNWHQGNRQGHFVFIQSEADTDQSYPASYSTWRYEFEATSNWESCDEVFYLQDGTRCTSRGKPLDEAYDLDEYFAKATPEKFLNEYAAKIYEAVINEDRSEVKSPTYKKDPLDLMGLWGCQNKEIDDIVNYAFEGADYEPVSQRRTFEGNIWRSLIDHPWQNYFEELAAVFMGAVQIGQFGDSDNVYATIFLPQRDKPLPNAVYLWSHETYYIDDVLALDLDTFAYRTALASAFDAERLSEDCARDGWRKLVGLTHASWGASAGIELLPDEDFAIDLDPDSVIRSYFWRAQWIIQLLRPDKERRYDEVSDCFRPNLVRCDDALFARRISVGERVPQLAIYNIWSSYWLNRADRLTQSLDKYRQHSAPIVRDLVLLMDDILAGKAAFKDIKDLNAVRKEFLALNLLTDKTESTKEHESKTESSAKSTTSSKSTTLDKLEQEAKAATEQNLASFIDMVWQNIHDAQSIEALEKLARNIDGYDLHWAAFDFVKRRCDTDNTEVYFDRVSETGAWLAQHNCDLLQPFIWTAQHKNDYATTAFLLKAIGESGPVLDKRLIPLCLAQLDIVEEYNQKREIAVTLLGIMQAYGCEQRLLALIDEYIKTVSDKVEFEASLETISWEELLSATARSLQGLAIPKSQVAQEVIAKLKQLLQILKQIHDVSITVTVLDALIAWGDTNLISTISRLLKCGDERGEKAALKAVEKLATHWSEEERRAFVALDFCNPSDYERTVTLLYYRAHNALAKADATLGDPVSIQDAVNEAMQLDCYREEAMTEWQIVECETVSLEPSLDLDCISSYLQSANTKVRKAAQNAYQSRGKTFEIMEPQLPWLNTLKN